VSLFSWANLTALGKNITGGGAIEDIEELDTAMNMTNLSDSLNRTYGPNGLTNNSFVVFSVNLTNVPIANSTNNSNFTTGILWDQTDENLGEFNATQDVVFVANINRNLTGTFGIYDFELRIPARLREYLTPNDDNRVTFYLELK